jgi:hypothetical protein
MHTNQNANLEEKENLFDSDPKEYFRYQKDYEDHGGGELEESEELGGLRH